MKKDPVEEIRERRRRLVAEKYHGSVDEIIAAGRKWEQEHPLRTVNLRDKKIKEREKLAG